MTTPSTSGGPPSFGLKEIVDRTITKATDSYYINTSIKKALYGLCFNKKRITLQVSDPSYRLRYQYAVRFWMEKTEKLENLSREVADDLVKELKSELNSKFCLYPEESNDNEENFGAFYSEEPKPKTRRTSKQHSVEPDEKPVWYLTSKCETKFYVKSANCSEDEKVVNKTDINLCSYSMICPGDEFQIESDGDKKRVCIIK